jgi:hypothetical protein
MISVHMLTNGVYNAGFRVSKFYFDTGVTFFIEDEVIRVMRTGSESISLSPKKTIYGDPFFLRAMDRYTLREMLSSLGKPDQVLMFVFPDKSTEAPDYYFLIYYPNRGVLLEYAGLSEERESALRLCPESAFIHMWLFSPNENFTALEAFSYAGSGAIELRKNWFDQFLSWEAATTMSIDDFVETFKAKNACFDTPAALWGRK